MKKSRNLQAVVAFKTLQENQALRELGQCQQKQQTFELQLEELAKYRRDYHEKYQSLCSSGVAVEQLLEFRSFISKLDRAVVEQQSQLKTLEMELQAKREKWRSAHQGAESMHKVNKKIRANQRRREQLREQMEMEDRGARNNNGTEDA